ncbi:type VII secretion protein EccCb, partial [uncultured Corynebacterium sp.]|uniref:type VII secretion protein EccCb n=1 Tax=uncultured Corynebacterium sp. TaxID=159447 RepID=UPI0025E4555B
EIDRDLPPVPMPLELVNTTEAWLDEHLAGERARISEQRAMEAAVQSTEVAGHASMDGQTTLDMVVARLVPAARRTRQIWLAPLPEQVGLEKALGPLSLDRGRGLSAQRSRYLTVALGIKDRPREQWQGPMTVDLSGAGGNMVVIGGPQAGKSTVLRTFITSLALTHSPVEVNVYAVDMGVSSLGYLERLPHVGGVASRFEAERVSRLVSEVAHWLEEREQLFLTEQISDVEELRRRRRAGELSELACTDLFLVIDDWTAFKKDFEGLVETVQDILQHGLGYGVHVIFANGRWADFRLPLQSAIGTKVELQINDPLDSIVGRRPMEAMAGSPTGRVLTTDTLQSQIALPTVAQPGVVRETTAQALVEAVDGAWESEKRAPAVRMLPELVEYDAVRAEFPGTPRAMVGIAEKDLHPVCFDLDGAQRHVLVFGDSGSGKTSTLRTLVREVVADAAPNSMMFGVFDMRRSLLGMVPEAFLGGYAGTRPAAEQLAKGMCMELERRLPPADVTVEQLRNRSWWSGPEMYILVDNLEMMEGSTNPLRPFVPYLAQAADLGLHVIVARRAAGLGRASYENFLQGMREAGASGLLLSGERQEGQVWPGVYMRHLPPGRGLFVGRSGVPQLMQVAFSAEG